MSATNWGIWGGPKNLFGLFLTFYLARQKQPCKVKITREMSIFVLVLKGIFRGSPKITLQNGNNPRG